MPTIPLLKIKKLNGIKIINVRIIDIKVMDKEGRMDKIKNNYKVGQKLKIEIEKIVFGGEGLGHIDGFTIFVPMSVPGDILEIEIISVKKSYARGLITEIIKVGNDRIKDTSKISFEDFDGCDFGMLKYEKQLEYKNEMLKEVLKKIGNINLENIEIENIIGSDIKTNYRNKTAEPLFKKDGKIMTGFYSKKSHNIFSAKESLLKSKIAEEIINKFLEEINKSGYNFNSIYDLMLLYEKDKNIVSVFLKYLKLFELDIKKHLVRFLGVKGFVSASKFFLEEFHKTKDFIYRFVIANTLSLIQDENILEDLIEIIENRMYGEARIPIIYRLYKFKNFQLEKVLVKLLNDKEVSKIAEYSLNKLKNI